MCSDASGGRGFDGHIHTPISPDAVRPSSLQRLPVDCESEYHRTLHVIEIKDVLEYFPNGCLSEGCLSFLKIIFMSGVYGENGDFC